MDTQLLMKKIKVSEFANRWQVTRQAVYKFAKEGKLVVVNGYLDETISTNRQWIEARQLRFSEQEIIEPENTENNDSKIEGLRLTELKKLNLKLDAEWKEMRNRERDNSLMPTEWAEKCLSYICHEIQSGLKNLIENALVAQLLNAGLNRETVCSARGSLTPILGKFLLDCQEKAKEMLIEDYKAIQQEKNIRESENKKS